jgi:hypothetical protein
VLVAVSREIGAPQICFLVRLNLSRFEIVSESDSRTSIAGQLFLDAPAPAAPCCASAERLKANIAANVSDRTNQLLFIPPL